eukprot:3292689-Rhodomonas_salina.1
MVDRLCQVPRSSPKSSSNSCPRHHACRVHADSTPSLPLPLSSTLTCFGAGGRQKAAGEAQVRCLLS